MLLSLDQVEEEENENDNTAQSTLQEASVDGTEIDEPKETASIVPEATVFSEAKQED